MENRKGNEGNITLKIDMKKLLDRIGQGLPISVPTNVCRWFDYLCKGELGRTSGCFDIMGMTHKDNYFQIFIRR